MRQTSTRHPSRAKEKSRSGLWKPIAPPHEHTTLAAIREDDDNRILECAVDGQADLIVSSDRDLLRMRTFQGIAIVHIGDFRRILGS